MNEGATYAVSPEALFVWGGRADRSYETADDGVLIDLETGATESVPPGPLAARIGASGAWTGREFLVVGGSSEQDAFSDAATYDPMSREWSLLPDVPLVAGSNPSTIMVDGRLILWMSRGHRPPNELPPAQAGQVAILDLTTREWTQLAPPPIEAIDAVLVPFGNTFALVGGPVMRDIGVIGSQAPVQVTVWDPTSKQWSPASVGPTTDSARPFVLATEQLAVATSTGTISAWVNSGWRAAVNTPGDCSWTLAATGSQGGGFVHYCEVFEFDSNLQLSAIAKPDVPLQITTPGLGTFLATEDDRLVVLVPSTASAPSTLAIYDPAG